MSKVVVAMSGGVDSSVAALLLKKEGFYVIGVMLKMLGCHCENTLSPKVCCSVNDADDARQVADKIAIPFYVLDYTKYFDKYVIKRFVEGYSNGETPNPCIDCNRFVKFGELIKQAEKLGFDFVATGHYAKIVFDKVSGRYLLKKSKNVAKDQSYVLYCLKQWQLSRILFPLGDMTKKEVRERAEKSGYSNAAKPDSQDICFVAKGKYLDFIHQYSGQRPAVGDFLDCQGAVIGKHVGHMNYTIGQRRGLGMGFDKRLYVGEKNHLLNTVTLVTEDKLFSNRVEVRDINLIAVEKISEPMKVQAKVRYGSALHSAVIFQTESDKIVAEFNNPQRAIAKGQAIVFYDDDVVIGGGVISSSSRSMKSRGYYHL